MDNQTINVPGAEEFARPRTRKDFFKALAAASIGAAAGTTLLTGKAFAQSGNTDVDIFNFALTLEYLEQEFYAIALDTGLLSGQALSVVQNLFAHESAHVEAITAALTGAGATPVAKPEFTFPPDAFASQASILNTSFTFEPVGVGAYLGAAPMIQSPDLLEAAGTIAGVEGDHVVAVGNLVGVVPPANTAFPAALTKDEVLAAVAPFLGMGSMMETGGAKPAGAGSEKAY